MSLPRGLRRRLRIAALIMVAGFGVFLLRTLVERPEDMVFQPSDKAIFAMVVALMAGVATVLFGVVPRAVVAA